MNVFLFETRLFFGQSNARLLSFHPSKKKMEGDGFGPNLNVDDSHEFRNFVKRAALFIGLGLLFVGVVFTSPRNQSRLDGMTADTISSCATPVSGNASHF